MGNLIRTFDTPWKISNQLRSWLAYPRVRLLFALNGIQWGQNWRFHGIPIIQKHRRSLMSFGRGLGLRSSLRSNPLSPNHPVILATLQEAARLQIGANFGMTGGTICAAERIIIGNNVVVGSNTIITDTDFHPLHPEQRSLKPSDGKTAAVVIEDNVFIGMNCLILKGLTIGKGSMVGAGSVVTMDVPSDVIVAGNPARLIRKLRPKKMPLSL